MGKSWEKRHNFLSNFDTKTPFFYVFIKFSNFKTLILTINKFTNTKPNSNFPIFEWIKLANWFRPLANGHLHLFFGFFFRILVILQIALFEIMRGYFSQPLRLYRHHISHKFLGRKHKLKINHPLRLSFEHKTRRVDQHTVSIFGRSINPIPVKLCSIVEKPTCKTFSINFIFKWKNT